MQSSCMHEHPESHESESWREKHFWLPWRQLEQPLSKMESRNIRQQSETAFGVLQRRSKSCKEIRRGRDQVSRRVRQIESSASSPTPLTGTRSRHRHLLLGLSTHTAVPAQPSSGNHYTT